MILVDNLLSPFLANIFLNKVENEIKSKFDSFPKFWIRYVGDIFAICRNTWICSKTSLQNGITTCEINPDNNHVLNPMSSVNSFILLNRLRWKESHPL